VGRQRERGGPSPHPALRCSQQPFSFIQTPFANIELLGTRHKPPLQLTREHDRTTRGRAFDNAELVGDKLGDPTPHRHPQRLTVATPHRPHGLRDRHPNHLVPLVVIKTGKDPAVDLGQRSPIQLHQNHLIGLHVYIGNCVARACGAEGGLIRDA
jgi:hypothetical protein